MDLYPQPADDITEFMRANPNSFAPDATLGAEPSNGQYVYEKDSSMAMFFPKAILNKVESRAQGRPVYMRVPYIEIRQPGEQLHIINRPATEEDKFRFAAAWQRFQKRAEIGHEGTPLDALFPFHPEIVLTLRANGVPTVEALGEMTDGAIGNFPFGGNELRETARRYLLAVSNPNGVKAVVQAEEVERLKAQARDSQALIDAQKASIAALEARLQALEVARNAPPGAIIPGPGDLEAGKAIEQRLEAERTASGRRK